VLVVGEEGLRRELTDAGLVADYAGDPTLGEPGTPESAPDSYAVVVVGLDRGFTYAGLARAHASVRAGGLFVATNLDVTLPADGRILPGAGAVVAAVAAATGQEPVAIGKPNLRLADALAASSGVPAGRTLFVGDRLDTDITFGVRAGMQTALVLTGVSQRRDLAGSQVQPDWVLESLLEFPALLGELVGRAE
jgi:4-nitrophenyl phosphatase